MAPVRQNIPEWSWEAPPTTNHWHAQGELQRMDNNPFHVTHGDMGIHWGRLQWINEDIDYQCEGSLPLWNMKCFNDRLFFLEALRKYHCYIFYRVSDKGQDSFNIVFIGGVTHTQSRSNSGVRLLHAGMKGLRKRDSYYFYLPLNKSQVWPQKSLRNQKLYLRVSSWLWTLWAVLNPNSNPKPDSVSSSKS